jgi:hypothetical protein
MQRNRKISGANVLRSTVKPAYNGNARDWIFSAAGRVLLIQVTEVKVPRDFHSFPEKQDFLLPRLHFREVFEDKLKILGTVKLLH